MKRRNFLQRSFQGGLAISLPAWMYSLASIEKPVSIGLIADLHQDIMHDGPIRMQAFADYMGNSQPDAIIQMGDFAYPNEKNRSVIDLFNSCHENSLHIIGNHDTDSGHTKDQCIDIWGMPGRYYSKVISGLRLIVLDGNEEGSPSHKGGYVSYIGKEQQQWLRDELESTTEPVIIFSHQPLAGTIAVDNAGEMQDLLGSFSDKILLALNGHSHIDDVLYIQGNHYVHINSASYYWVGGDYKHESYSPEIHEKHPWISSTCPYREALFTMLTIDPVQKKILIEGRSSSWVGASPFELGFERVELKDEIVPGISDRVFAME